MEKQSNPNPGPNHHASMSSIESGIEDRDLRIEMFALCEAAFDQEGRLTVMGVFESVGVPYIPIVIPQISVALRLRFWPAELPQHSVRWVVTNPDGRPVTHGLEAQVVNPAANRDRSSGCNLIVKIHSLPIAETGEYSVDFYRNDRLEGRLPFCVLPKPSDPSLL